MHYVNQVGLSRISRFIKRDFRTIPVNFDQLKAYKSFWVMQNPEISLNTLMNEQQISRNCKSAHRTMIYVTKVIWSWAQPGVISLTGSRLTILDGDVVGLKDKPKEMRVNECILPRWWENHHNYDYGAISFKWLCIRKDFQKWKEQSSVFESVAQDGFNCRPSVRYSVIDLRLIILKSL